MKKFMTDCQFMTIQQNFSVSIVYAILASIAMNFSINQEIFIPVA